MSTRVSVAGHPVHPMLVPIPIGLWIFSLICDLVFIVDGRSSLGGNRVLYARRRHRRCSARCDPGLDRSARAARLPCTTHRRIPPGAEPRDRRGAGGELLAAHGGRRQRVLPRAISIVAVAALVASGWLGGHLVHVLGVTQPQNVGEAERRHDQLHPRTCSRRRRIVRAGNACKRDDCCGEDCQRSHKPTMPGYSHAKLPARAIASKRPCARSLPARARTGCRCDRLGQTRLFAANHMHLAPLCGRRDRPAKTGSQGCSSQRAIPPTTRADDASPPTRGLRGQLRLKYRRYGLQPSRQLAARPFELRRVERGELHHRQLGCSIDRESARNAEHP